MYALGLMRCNKAPKKSSFEQLKRSQNNQLTNQYSWSVKKKSVFVSRLFYFYSNL